MATNPQEEPPNNTWAEDTVTRIGQTARRIRGKRSARWLSEQTEQLGHRISPQVIARLDTGRRNDHLNVTELVILARALGIAPIELLYGDLPDGEVEVLPGQTTRSIEAVQWFSGEDPLHDFAGTTDTDNYQLIQLSRELQNALAQIARLEDEIETRTAQLLEAQTTGQGDPTVIKTQLDAARQVKTALIDSYDRLTTEISRQRHNRGLDKPGDAQ